MTLLLEAEADRALVAPIRGLSKIERAYSVEGVHVERAASGDAEHIVDFFGHATVYGKGYEMYGGPDKGGWTEYVDQGAGKKTLSEKPDVAFLVNHGGLTLARTKAGTLTLAEKPVGLETKAKLDTRVSAVNDLVLLMEAGNLDEMSFAFRVVKQVWLNIDGEEVPWWDLAGIERHITEYSIHKGDVSVVNYGANPHTDATLRSLDDQARLRADLLGQETLPNERAADGPDDALEAQKVELELRQRRLAQATI